MAGYGKMQFQAAAAPKATNLYTTTANVAFGAQVQSAYIDVSRYRNLLVGRAVTGGTYVFEIDWSNDGVTLLFTETITVANNDDAIEDCVALFARFRVKNTDGAVNFSAHTTFVNAR